MSAFLVEKPHTKKDYSLFSRLTLNIAGLPEEMRIRLAILRRGYAVIGISSEERVKGCWREIKEDGGEGVARVLEKIIKKLNLNSKPFIAMGASSGGQLALLLPRVMKVHVSLVLVWLFIEKRKKKTCFRVLRKIDTH